MRITKLLFIMTVSLLVCTLAWPAETAKVVRIVEGDTLQVDIGGKVETVRLIGVDTPETVHLAGLRLGIHEIPATLMEEHLESEGDV